MAQGQLTVLFCVPLLYPPGHRFDSVRLCMNGNLFGALLSLVSCSTLSGTALVTTLCTLEYLHLKPLQHIHILQMSNRWGFHLCDLLYTGRMRFPDPLLGTSERRELFKAYFVHMPMPYMYQIFGSRAKHPYSSISYYPAVFIQRRSCADF